MSYKVPQKVQKVMVQPINLIFRHLQNRAKVQVSWNNSRARELRYSIFCAVVLGMATGKNPFENRRTHSGFRRVHEFGAGRSLWSQHQSRFAQTRWPYTIKRRKHHVNTEYDSINWLKTRVLSKKCLDLSIVL